MSALFDASGDATQRQLRRRQSKVGEAGGCAAGDDEVIQHTNVNESQRFAL